MKWEKYYSQICQLCETALTFTEIETKLGTSTPNRPLRAYIKIKKIPMPCFLGQHIGKTCIQKSRITDESLTINSLKASNSIKKYLYRKGYKTPKCELCGWNEKRKDGSIPVELHHINGDHTDNRLENLQILCPNCHALTPNYAGKNKLNKNRQAKQKERIEFYKVPTIICEVCKKLGYHKFCSQECSHMAQRQTTHPSAEQLELEIKEFSWTALGKKYGVSDNAVRKWAKKYGLI